MIILEKLKREITRYDKPENRLNYQKFFKEKLEHPVSIKTAILRKISNNCFKEVEGKPAAEILDICDELLESGERYMRFFAFDWAEKVKGNYRKSDFGRFERWLKNYVNNWGSFFLRCPRVFNQAISRTGFENDEMGEVGKPLVPAGSGREPYSAR